MKRSFILMGIIIVILAAVFCVIKFRDSKKTYSAVSLQEPKVKEISPAEDFSNRASEESNPKTSIEAPSFQASLDRASERITKKKFGQFITPQNSLVQPERFRGYHTGTDFEVFPEELEKDVEMKAICAGKLVLKRTASGYGGVVVQSCELDGKPITVLYGHMKLASVGKKIGEEIEIGERIGFLGANKSAETDGERKHLHLSIHRGSAINIEGYVQSQTELSGWIDSCGVESVCQ